MPRWDCSYPLTHRLFSYNTVQNHIGIARQNNVPAEDTGNPYKEHYASFRMLLPQGIGAYNPCPAFLNTPLLRPTVVGLRDQRWSAYYILPVPIWPTT